MGLVALKVTTNLPAEFRSLISAISQSVSVSLFPPFIASSGSKLCPDFVLCNVVVSLARDLGT